MAVIGVIAQGMMGAGVGRRLHESGATVRTLLSGRSRASAERAEKAGMIAAANERELLSGADFFLSILPPGEAGALAQHLTPALKALDRKPVYVDCNAVSPQTAIRVGEIVAPTGAHFVDAGIIGGPPRPGYSPTIYASGPTAGQTAVFGLGDRLARHRELRHARLRDAAHAHGLDQLVDASGAYAGNPGFLDH